MHKHMIKDNNKRQMAKKIETKRIAAKTHLNDGELYMRRNFNIWPNAYNNIPGNICAHRNRCVITGRSRGIHTKYFKISRIMIRELASKGLLPGVKKASW